MDALERRIDGLKSEMRRALAAVEGGVEALREERAEEMRGVRRRLAQVETRQGAQGVEEAPGPVRQPPGGARPGGSTPSWRPASLPTTTRTAFGPAWPLIVEWRGLKDSHPNQGKGLSWLVAEERLMEVEVALLEEHGLTLPPETQPLRGLERGS